MKMVAKKNGVIHEAPEEEPIRAMPEGMDDVLLGADEERTEMDKVLEIVTDPAKIGYFTQLTSREVTAFSALGAIAAKYPELSMLRGFLAQNLEYRVSTNRKGREELVRIVGRQLAMAEERAEPVHGWKRFMGGRR